MTKKTLNGRKIRDLRQAKGIDQQTMAGALGISQTMLSRYERGYQKSHSATVLIDICKYLGVSLSDLYDHEDEVKQNQRLDVHVFLHVVGPYEEK
jgi:transcriptional regulator with XRE-family HTH domain